MPRFLGKKSYMLWWNIAGLILLALVVIVVLELTGATHIFT